MAGVARGVKLYMWELEQQCSFYRSLLRTMDRHEHKKPLTDDDLMPFGQHKGTSMKAVPADYLLWLLRQEWIKQWKGVYDYVIKNQDLLLAEMPEQDDHDEGGFDSFEDYQRYGR